MVCLLENVELSLRLYLQVNMGTSVSAELYSFPWRIVALRAPRRFAFRQTMVFFCRDIRARLGTKTSELAKMVLKF